MRAMLFALAASLTFGLCACESTASGDSLAQAVEGRVWSAEAIGGKDVVDGTKVTLKIEGGRVSGKAGCNLYGGPVEINGERIKFGALFSTKMACMGGGVAEWVADCWHRSYQGAPNDGSVAWDTPDCAVRVLRGGGWLEDVAAQRVSARVSFDAAVQDPAHGFRVAAAR